MKRVLLAMIGLVAAGLGVIKMAELTMTRHEPVPPDSRMAVVVEAYTKGHTAHGRLQMARSLFMACRLQTNSTTVEDDFRQLSPDTFRFVLRPTLDDSDQRQLRGCVEDARIDELQLDVRSIERVDKGAQG
jgi:hypothetical protein